MYITTRFQSLILSTFLLWAAAFTLAPAQTECLDFEDFPQGPVFGPFLGNSPGDTLLNEDGLVVTAQAIIYENGLTGFQDAVIEGDNVGWLDGQFLFMGNNAIELSYEGGVQTVCFDFFDGGGEENVSVNGSPVALLQNFAEVADLDIPGVEIELTLDSANANTFLSAGTVCFSGDIQSILVGGQEFGLDNVCATAADSNSGSCVEFEGMEAPGYGVGVTMPGVVFYEESEVNMRLIPFQTLFWTTTYGFLRVQEQGNLPGFMSASGQYVSFEEINAIFDFTGYPEPVEEVTVDFHYNPTGDGAVNFAANGAAFLIQFNLMPGFYALAPGVTLEVVYENNSMSEGQLIFAGNIQTLLIGGASGLSIDNLCVNPEPPCPLGELTVEAGDCNQNDEFQAILDLDYTGSPSDTLILSVNGNENYHLAGDFPLSVGPFVAPTDSILFSIALFGQPSCAVSATLPPQDCGAGCTLEGYNIEYVECGVGEDFYNVGFSFAGVEAGDAVKVTSLLSGASDLVEYNGQLIEVVFPNTGVFFDELEVCLDNAESCCITFVLDLPCQPCELQNVTIDALPCDGDSLYSFVLDFDPVGQVSDLFTIATSNGAQDTFAYTDLPVTVGPVLGYGEVIYIWIQDFNGNCGYYNQLISPDCEDDCVLGDVSIVGNAGCNNNGTYNVPLNVENTVAGDEVLVTSMTTGYEEVIQVGVLNTNFLQLSNWPVPPNGADSLSICFANQPNCCTSFAFSLPCEPGCNFEAEVSLLSCDPGGVMTFEVTTSSDDPAVGQYINIIVGDIQYGLVAINTTVEVGLLINEGEDEVDVVIENWSGFFSGPICSIVETVDVSSCVSNCAGPFVEAIPEACSSSNPGAYELHLEISPDTNANPVYDFYANGDVVIQQIFLPNGSTTLEVLPYNPGTSPDVITVCYHQEPECCTSIYIDPLQCDCVDIEGMVANMLPCEESGEYFVEIDLNLASNFGFPFDLEVDGAFYGTYLPEDIPIIVGPFAGDGAPHSFYAQGDGECQGAEDEVAGQFCDGDCPIEGVEIVTAPACNNFNASFYYGALELLGVNLPGDTVVITSQISGEISYGVLDPNEGSVFDFSLQNTNLGYDVVTVCLFNQPNCCFEIDYDINCPPCDIQEWVVEPQECQADGTFSLFVDIVFEGAPTGIEVIIPGLNYGNVFDSGTFPVELPGFVGDGNNYDVFLIPGCGNEVLTEVEFPDCDTIAGCFFEEVIVEPHPCEDGEFFVDIEVQVNEEGMLGYYVFGDGEIFGPFSYDEPFVTVGPFAGDGETVYDFLILDIENPACFGYAEFGPKDCDNNNCGILSMVADPLECNGDGTYDLFLDIQVEDPNEDLLFWFYLNGEYIGQSTLAGLPGELINLPLTDTENVVFKACIFDQPDCCVEVEYPQPDCLNNNCPIDNVTVDFAFCDTTGFYVELDFDGPAPNTAGSYRIFGNGEVYDTLSYDEPRPIVVGPFDPYTDNIYELIVADLQQPNCSDFVEFPAFNCEEGQEVCIDFSAFDGFSASNDANGDGLIGTESGVDIKYEALANNFPTALTIEENPYPEFEDGDGSVVIFSNAKVGFEVGPLPSIASSRTMTMDFHFPVWVDSIQVYANGDFHSIYLPLPTNPGDVQLGDDITMSFDYSTPATTGTITVEGPIESFYFSLLPNYTMVLDNICITNVLDAVCGVENVEVDALGCDEDGQYRLLLDFEVQNADNDFFDLYSGDGDFIGFYALEELPLELDGFNVADGSLDSIKICVNDDPDCCTTVAYEVPDCDNLAGCLDFDAFAGFDSPPNDGGQGLVEVGSDAGVDFSYAIADFCDCFVKVVPADNAPFFDAAAGEMVEFFQAELLFEFSETAIEASFDYSTQESDMLYIRDGFPVGVELDTLPFNEEVPLPDGTTIEKTTFTNVPGSGNSATITIRGEIDKIKLFGSGFVDNLCWTPADQDVWPGDANANGLAHHIDLLSIGLGYGVSGPERLVDGTGWMPTVAPDWDSLFVDGTNYKHADCNGDGIIDAEDRFAILENYGLEHGTPEPIEELPGTALDPPAFVDIDEEQLAGASFEAPIMVGSEMQPVEDAYGIAFTVNFDPELIDPNAIEVIYPTSWFGQPGVNTLTIHKIYEEGKIEIALTRTDHNNVSGHGAVAYIIGIIDDIAGYQSSEVDLSHFYAIDKGEVRLPIQGRSTTFTVDAESSIINPGAEGAFTIFPNPTMDWVNIHSKHGFVPDALQLYGIDGRRLPVRTDGTNQRVSLEGLPQGAYILQITSGKAAVRKRIIKQ
jgi:hypothetical protein